MSDEYITLGGHGAMGFTSDGGGIHHAAIIGQAPEHRDHSPASRCWPVLVHHTARIEALVTVDSGCFRHTTIGARSWLMKHVHVGHDVLIGEDCELTPGVVVGGECLISDRVKIGLNATIRPRTIIGPDAQIGMGAVVLSDVPAGAIVVGNPARVLRFKDGFAAAA